MKLQFKLDQAEALRQGVDASTSVVAIEINPQTLTQEERNLLADRMDGINVRELTTWGGVSAPGHSEKHITAMGGNYGLPLNEVAEYLRKAEPLGWTALIQC